MTDTILVFALSLCVVGRCAAAGPKPAPEAVRRLERSWRSIEPVRPGMSSRGLFGFALEAAAAGYRPERIARALELAEEMQDRDKASRTFGNFRWYWRADRPEDLNAVEFCMQKGILVWMLYRDRLNGEARQRLRRLIRYSVDGVARHRVREGYTNIFLMKTWNCIAIGESTDRPEFARQGYAMLDRWLIHTWENGISEYISPTYYGVDLECLGLIARHARNPEARKGAEAALRLFWTDIAANWFAPCRRLGGAHSRDYDFLTGHGHLDRLLRPVGWLPQPDGYAPDTFLTLCKWAPPAGLRKAIAARTPRVVHQRWGAGSGRRACHYVGRHFRIGSAGANYGPMDKVLTVNLAGGPEMPVMNFLMDARGDPYGKKRIPAGGGHSKTFHIQPFVTSVQRGPEVLLLASADPASPLFRRRAPNPTCLLSHLVVPYAVEIWMARAPGPVNLRIAPFGAPSFAPGEPIFLRLEDVAVGVRFPLALDTSGRAVSAGVFADGGKYRVMRLTCVHSADKPAGRATVALWVRAAEGLDDDAFEKFRRDFSQPAETKIDGDRVDVSVPGLKGWLRLVADVAAERRIAVEGGEPGAEEYLLAVDGRDVGREALGGVEVVRRYRELLSAARSGGGDAPAAGGVVEAEAAAIVIPPFRIDAGAGASGGKFLWMPGEPGGKSGSGVARAVWCVHVPKGGTYCLWARVRTPTPSDDSFFVRVRQGRRDVLPRSDWHTGVHGQWQWVRVAVAAGRRPAAVALKPGAAVIEFQCREDGARLDAICLTAEADWRPPK